MGGFIYYFNHGLKWCSIFCNTSSLNKFYFNNERYLDLNYVYFKNRIFKFNPYFKV